MTKTPATTPTAPGTQSTNPPAEGQTNAVALKVNGVSHELHVAARTTLADLLRDHLDLTGTHLGCEHGVCGACTVLLEGEPIRSCITLAASCEGSDVTTIEGAEGSLIEALRDAFATEHGLQCGFCTPAMVLTAADILQRKPNITADEVRTELSGNLCRCTGYVGIVRAVLKAASRGEERADHDLPTLTNHRESERRSRDES